MDPSRSGAQHPITTALSEQRVVLDELRHVSPDAVPGLRPRLVSRS